jgi:PHP family Zn ribbon phosphoesterase
MARYSADLHLHSRNGQGPIARMEIYNLARHAVRKGLQVVGTGDCLHPDRFQEIQRGLCPLENGLFQIPGQPETHFLLSTELAVPIHRRDRRPWLHLLLLLPSLAAIEKLWRVLPPPVFSREGMPIYRVLAYQFLQIVQNSQPDAMLIPAHIFNPANSLFSRGKNQGSLACQFEEWNIFFPAIETGLSADPFHCWRLKALDEKTLVSFSDARTPEELGKEVTLFSAEMSYPGICRALRGNNTDRVIGTLELCSELGSHFFNGHKHCGIARSPLETRLEGDACPACSSPLTIGTMQRTQELADRSPSELNLYQQNGWIHTRPSERSPYRKIIPLREVIISSGIVNGRESRKVEVIYENLARSGLTELEILLNVPPRELLAYAPVPLVEALQRTRENRFRIEPGYDGVPGRLTIMEESVRLKDAQLSLFR